jgi:tyrosine-protein kinase Etk/Wzc
MGSISSFHDVLAALRRQAWLILLILAAGLPVVYWYATSRPRVYDAVAVLGVGGPQVTDPNIDVSRQLDEIQQALMSRDNLAEQVDRFDLFDGLMSENERIGLTRGAITITKLIDPAQAWQPNAQPYGLSITVRLADPDQAASLANALLDSIVTEDARRARLRASATLDRTNEALDYLTAEEERLQAAIVDVENQIAEFRAANVASLPESLSAVRDQRTRLVSDRIALDRDLIEFEDVQGLRSDVAGRQRQLLQEERDMLSAAIAEAEAALASAPYVERQLGALTRRLASLEAELGAVLTQRTEAGMSQYLASQVRAEHFTVLETAMPPEFPVSADQRKIALAGAVAVAALAFGLAFAREILNPVLRTAAQMQRELGVEPVVVIPSVTSRAVARRRQGLAALFLAFLVGVAAVGTAAALARSDLIPSGLSARADG